MELMKRRRESPAALAAWDPFEMLRGQMARMWGAPMAAWPGLARESVLAPRVDMFERDHTLVVKTDLPGIKKEDVEVSVEDGDLVICGEHKEEKETKADEYYRMERSSGSFYRRLALPFEADEKKIQARFTDGVLEVEIERPPEMKPQARKIAVR